MWADSEGSKCQSHATRSSEGSQWASEMTRNSPFPQKKFASAGAYFDGYVEEVTAGVKSVDRDQLSKAGEILVAALNRDATIYACGNGGSAAIANHMISDHQKSVHTDTHFRPKVVSLSSSTEMITAIGNDIDFADIFVHPLRIAARPGDLLISISSSGNSENIVRAVRWAKENGLDTIAFTGFDGGRSADIADVNLHVNAHNYGVVEDIHQSFMHVLAQYVRQSAMSLGLIEEHTF